MVVFCGGHEALVRSRCGEIMLVIVIVQAWNEAGNLGEILNRLPAFGTSREVVFMEGGLTNGTWRNRCGGNSKTSGRKSAGAATTRQRQGTNGAAGRRFVSRRMDLHIERRYFQGFGGAERAYTRLCKGKARTSSTAIALPARWNSGHEVSQLVWQQGVCLADYLSIGTTLLGRLVRN